VPRLSLRQRELRARSFEQETIVLDLRSSMYLSTNPAGSILWRRLELGTTRSELIDALVSEFEIEWERAAQDVDAFLQDCRQRNLIVEDDQPETPGSAG